MRIAATLQRPLRGWLARRYGAPGGPIVLRYRRIYILPTRLGLAFAGMLVLMWIGAINYNNNLAFMLTFLLAGISISAMHHVFHNLVGLRLVPLAAEPVFAGDRARFPVLLENPYRRPRLAVEVNGREDGGVEYVDVPAAGTARAWVHRRAHRRGRLQAGRIAVATRYPGGLFRAWGGFLPGTECLVYPAPETGAVPWPERPGGRRGGNGAGAGDEDFAGLRPYRPGDPVRRIAWKATHTREPQVKTFAGEAPARRWLRWQDTEGGVEARLSRLCRWVMDAEQEGRSYGLDLPGRLIQPGRGAAHRHHCLAALALFGETPT